MHAGVVGRYAVRTEIHSTFDHSFWMACIVSLQLLQLATMMGRPAFYSRHRAAIAEANRAFRLAENVYRCPRTTSARCSTAACLSALHA